jgi:predicted DNA-binding protein (MmcQ/YjbR family)
VDAVPAKLLSFALSLPEAVEDHPWNETVAKVRKKVFVFFGGDPSANRITVKLVESHGHALSIDGAEPTGYGLGKAGWVTVPVDAEDVDFELLCDWIEECYRIVAPKRLVSELDADTTQRASAK